MGKATEIANRLQERPLQPGELYPIRPEIRVRPDAPAMQVDENTPAESVLGQAQTTGAIVVRGAEGDPRAVVLSPERYAELAGCEIESEGRFKATLRGTIEPDPEALEELMIEQVNPAEQWEFGSRNWREPDTRQE